MRSVLDGREIVRGAIMKVGTWLQFIIALIGAAFFVGFLISI
jgi:hypothetical protein